MAWEIRYKRLEHMTFIEEDIINRTNNPLERYNRTLKARFNTICPSLSVFVETIKAESIRVVDKLEAVENRHELPPDRDYIPYPRISEDYYNFKNQLIANETD